MSLKYRNVRVEKIDLISAAGMLDMKANAYRRSRDGHVILELRTKRKEEAWRLWRSLKVGKVHGPYKREGEKDLYLFQAFGEDKVRKVFKLVGPYIGPTLRCRIRKALRKEA